MNEEKKRRNRENAKRYYQKNKEKILKRQKEYTKKRYKEDEEFREKIKEKNRNYVINNPEKAREIKRKSQYKYINKKRLSGELPLTQKMLIDNLEQENQQLKEEKERLKNCYSSITIVGRQQGRAYEEAKRYISVCDLLGLKDIKITLVDSEDKKRIEKAIEYIENISNCDFFRNDYLDEVSKILKGEESNEIRSRNVCKNTKRN